MLSSPFASMMEVTATGPTASWREEPRMAYAMQGTKAPYRPYSAAQQ